MCQHARVIALVLGMLAVAGYATGGPDARSSSPKTSSPPVQKTTADKISEGTATSPTPPQTPRTYIAPTREPREMTLVSIPVANAPIIDGRANEPFWNTAPAITTLDFSSQRSITIRSVYTTQEIFFLVTYPKDTPEETHKSWRWDTKEEVYREGSDREDAFVFKWSLSGNKVSLRLHAPEPHRGDIWFWKAFRTNRAGYADDKWQAVSLKPGPGSKEIKSSTNGTLHFRRVGDAGKAAYQDKLFFEYNGDTLPAYEHTKPSGSRGDVRAKGVWSNKQWTIEFGRKLKTGHDDDVALTPGAVYLFGVSCYPMANDTPHASWSQPLYRTGDAFDRLFLTFAPRAGK